MGNGNIFILLNKENSNSCKFARKEIGSKTKNFPTLTSGQFFPKN